MDEETPYVGMSHGGRALVLMGDDAPEECAGWLDTALAELRELRELVESESLEVDLPEDWRDFCEQIGVSVESKFWEGSMISGQFMMGWISARGETPAKRRSGRLLKKLFKQAQSASASKTRGLIRGAEDINDLRTILQAKQIREANVAQDAELRSAKKVIESLRAEVAAMRVMDAAQLRNECVELALAAIQGVSEPRIAGPLAVWKDGAIYFLAQRGGVRIPTDSVFSLILEALKAVGKPIHEIQEVSTTRGYLSGPHPVRGGTRFIEWANVWSSREPVARSFKTDDPSIALVAAQIVDFARSLPAP